MTHICMRHLIWMPKLNIVNVYAFDGVQWIMWRDPYIYAIFYFKCQNLTDVPKFSWCARVAKLISPPTGVSKSDLHMFSQRANTSGAIINSESKSEVHMFSERSNILVCIYIYIHRIWTAFARQWYDCLFDHNNDNTYDDNTWNPVYLRFHIYLYIYMCTYIYISI